MIQDHVRLVLCLVFLLAITVFADTMFTGAIDERWDNPDNWSDGLPDANDKVSFLDGQMCVLDHDAGVIKHLAMQGGGTDHLRLVEGAVLTVGHASGDGWTIIGYNGVPEEAHLLEILDGKFNAEKRTFIGFQGKGRMVIDYTGVFNQNGQEFGIGQETNNGAGRVEVRGGSLNLFNHNLVFRNGEGATASLDFSGGVLTQEFSDLRLVNILDHIADGTITAYYDFDLGQAAGEVIVDTGDANDYIRVSGHHPFDPFPEDSGVIVPGETTLRWTVEEGTEVDVWLDTLPDLSTAELVVDKQAVTSVQVNLEKGIRYFWAVDIYVPGVEESVWGPTFDVYVDNLAPDVQILGGDVTVIFAAGGIVVPLVGTVEDIDPTTVVWTVMSEPSEGAAVIADPEQLETTVTLSKMGTYVLQLAADDGEKVGTTSVTVTVKSKRPR